MRFENRRSIKAVIIWIAALVFAYFLINFVLHNFTGIGPVPTRSAFSSRLPSLGGENERTYRFFYASNREDTEETFKERGNVRGKEILHGTFDVHISPYTPIEPFAWFDEYKMEWKGHKPLFDKDFNLKIKEAVQESPDKSLLIIVWGYRDWFQSAALKTAYTAYCLDINTPALLFDWPGNQGDGFRGYLAARNVAAESAEDLGRVVADVVRSTGAEKVWLLGSSLGCQVICDSLAWLSTQPDLIEGKPKLSHVVLSAPDVSANAFDKKFSERIEKLSEHLTAYVSSNDRALLMSQWLNRSRRLGRTREVTVPPEERKTQYEFEEAAELLELQAEGLRNIYVVDATPINYTRNLHHFFTDSPVFFDDLYQRLLRPDDIVNRRLHSVRTSDRGMAYYILWQD